MTIGNNVTRIYREAFSGCSGLKKVIVKDLAAWCNIYFASFDSNPLSYSHHLYSDENTEITNLVIPNSVTSINNYAFYCGSGFASVTIPNSILSIADYAFQNCTGLIRPIYNSTIFVYMSPTYQGSYIIPSGISYIMNYAFYGCSNLTSLTIPNSVTRIGNHAFWYCTGLTSLTIPNSVTSIGGSAFEGCGGLTSLTIPNSVKTLGSNAIRNCSKLTSVSIGNGLTEIYTSTFRNCRNLTTIILGDKIEKIAYEAFNFCDKIEDLYCYSRIIKDASPTAFLNCKIEWCTLHVPESSITLYSKNKPWSEFGNIVALTADDPKPTGVIDVRSDNEATITEYFSPDGQRLDAPRKGVNIVKMSDGTLKKVVIK